MEDLLLWKDGFILGALIGAVLSLGAAILFMWPLR